MRDEALIALADDAIARRLAAAWPSVRTRWKKRKRCLLEWAALSGLPPIIVERKATTLFGLAICRADGTIDPLAAKYLARHAVERGIGPSAITKRTPKDKQAT